PDAISLASLCATTPFGVVTMSIPTSLEGRYRLPHFSNSGTVEENLGRTLPQLLTLPRSWILNFPPRPSSTNSNSPTQPYFCITRRTCPMSIEAGQTMQSCLCLG